jgi:fimbrial chaperone protein
MRRLATGCAAAWFLCGVLTAYASGLQVAPTSLALIPQQNADGLWLSNTGAAPLHAQVRVFLWTQEGGEERLTASRDLVVSPPLIELAAGARQLVRVIRTRPAAPDREDAYRLLVDELPLPDPAAEARRGLQFVLRYSVPVFLAPAGAAPQLQGRLVDEGGRRLLMVANRGALHAQLGNLARIDAQGRRTELVPGLLGYVLAGSTMRWPLPADAPVAAAGDRLLSRINGAPDEQTVAIAGVSP